LKSYLELGLIEKQSTMRRYEDTHVKKGFMLAWSSENNKKR